MLSVEGKRGYECDNCNSINSNTVNVILTAADDNETSDDNDSVKFYEQLLQQQ